MITITSGQYANEDHSAASIFTVEDAAMSTSQAHRPEAA